MKENSFFNSEKSHDSYCFRIFLSIKEHAAYRRQTSSILHINLKRDLEMDLCTITILLSLLGNSFESAIKNTTADVVGFKLLGMYRKF